LEGSPTDQLISALESARQAVDSGAAERTLSRWVAAGAALT
jgi:hypothetical protein